MATFCPKSPACLIVLFFLTFLAGVFEGTNLCSIRRGTLLSVLSPFNLKTSSSMVTRTSMADPAAASATVENHSAVTPAAAPAAAPVAAPVVAPVAAPVAASAAVEDHSALEWPGGPGGALSWCNELGNDDEVFECCYREREAYKRALGTRKVYVKGRTEAFGGWGSAATEEVKLLASMLRSSEKRAAQGRAFTVCETGFNWGGTSHIFLCASRTNATVLSFDIEQKTKIPAETLKWRYGSRTKVTIGNSKQLLARLASSASPPDCNFVFVDGGHDKSSAKSDMINFGKMVQPGTPMVADDCPAAKGVKQAFNDMINEGVLTSEGAQGFSDLKWRSVCKATYIRRP